MFDALRRMILPIILIVLLLFAGMIVLEWGMGLSGRQRFADANVAGVVNGEEISWERYNTILNNMMQSEQQDSDEDLPDAKVRELQLEAWKQVVQDQIMQQKVRDEAIVVTDEELFSYLAYSPPPELRTLPYFLTNGQFDYQKYQQAMLDPQAAPFWSQIEAAARNDIAKMKVQELVLQDVQVTENEVREWFLGSQEKVTVGMINVDFARFSRPAPTGTAEEIEAYFNAHRDKYTVEERAALNVVL
nr:SurA N-terminal domain-containing protein [candidate division Zixibacteria bacterium]